MIFNPLPIPGAFEIGIEPQVDERGHFARLWCLDELRAHGVDVQMTQSSVSYNRRAGTLRGMHYARAPAREGKLVRCERGRFCDVIVDLRKDSPAYLLHEMLELDSAGQRAVWIPPGVAHGFQTLEDDTTVVYVMSEAYRPELAAGVRFDDPAFGVRWPLPVHAISERDRTYPDYRDAAELVRDEQ